MPGWPGLRRRPLPGAGQDRLEVNRRAGPLIRDRVRGKGSSARDQGTLWLNIVITAAVVTAGTLTGVVKNVTAWQFGSAGLSVAGIR
jgi:hypothetical protein